MQRFTDRTVIVTGGGSGIGQATVLRLLDEGARVHAFDISEAGLADTVDRARAAGSDTLLATRGVDIADPESVRAAVAGVLDAGHGLDALVNAAAIQTVGHTHEVDLADWNRVLTVNLTGTFIMIQACLPALLDTGRGVIVNFTSTAARFAHPYMAAYSASKGGILSLTHTLALEYADRGLRVVNIQPGGVATPLAQQSFASMPKDFNPGLWAKQSPILAGGALAAPASVAAVVAMVASDDGAGITGTEIRVDSGAHA